MTRLKQIYKASQIILNNMSIYTLIYDLEISAVRSLKGGKPCISLIAPLHLSLLPAATCNHYTGVTDPPLTRSARLEINGTCNNIGMSSSLEFQIWPAMCRSKEHFVPGLFEFLFESSHTVPVLWFPIVKLSRFAIIVYPNTPYSMTHQLAWR